MFSWVDAAECLANMLMGNSSRAPLRLKKKGTVVWETASKVAASDSHPLFMTLCSSLFTH